MRSRKIASHFFITENGEVFRKPIIELNSQKKIHFRVTADDFKEEPGVEFYSGILIPFFVDVISIEDNYSEGDLRARVGELISQGVELIALPEFIIRNSNIQSEFSNCKFICCSQQHIEAVVKLRADFFKLRKEDVISSLSLLNTFCKISGQDIVRAIDVLIYQSAKLLLIEDCIAFWQENLTSVRLLSGVDLLSFKTLGKINIKKLTCR